MIKLKSQATDNHGNIFDAYITESYGKSTLMLKESTGNTSGSWSWHIETLQGKDGYRDGRIGDEIALDSGQNWYVTGMTEIMNELE